MNCPVCGQSIREEKIYCEVCGFVCRLVSDENEQDYRDRFRISQSIWSHMKSCPHKPEFVVSRKRRIMFCTDLYASSDYAFKSAAELARECDAELIVFHVLESRHRYSGNVITADGETWASHEVFDRLKRCLRQYYTAKLGVGPEIRMRVETRSGTPWVEILRAARKEEVDMIVTGPYSIKDPSMNGFDLSRPHLGDTVSKVSLRAHCPVAIVTSPDQRLSLDIKSD